MVFADYDKNRLKTFLIIKLKNKKNHSIQQASIGMIMNGVGGMHCECHVSGSHVVRARDGVLAERKFHFLRHTTTHGSS